MAPPSDRGQDPPPEAAKVSTRADLAVATFASREHGIVDASELAACGLSSGAISVRARNGRLHRLYRGVYAVGHEGLSIRGRLLAAVKACRPGAVLSHRSAAVLWGFLDEDSRRPEVTVPVTRRRRVSGIHVHRIRFRDDEWLIYDRIPVTTPVRTIIDLAAVLDERALRDVLRRAIGIRRVRSRQLTRALSRVRARPGLKQLRRLIADGVPTRSELEDVVLDLLIEGGFERADVNVPLILDGRRVVPDFRWPSARLVIEADGGAWHDHPVARAADLERQRVLEAHGETVFRITWTQAVVEPARTLRRIRAAGAPTVDAAAPLGPGA